jgi:phospholipid/cholesterol/gamma-HCH transport system permease protein
MTSGSLQTSREGETLVLRAAGGWTIESSPALDAALRRLPGTPGGQGAAVRFDLAAIEALDTAGAWLIARAQRTFEAAGAKVTLSGTKPAHAALLTRVIEAGAPPPPPHPRHGLIEIVAHLGEATVNALRQARDLIGFFGAVIFAIGRVVSHPSRIRFTSFVSHLEQGGLNAIPIVGLINFLVGIVIAYQGAAQLRRFGAEVYTVDTVGILVLRELGILLTAIIVAGRSGSAYTAQIGMMRVNEEVDALRTLGLDPLEVLVLPRIFALIVALPLLTFFADVMAIIGGALISTVIIDVTIPQFFGQLNQAIDLTTFWVGMVKAPIFAFIIAMVGCFEGMRVSGSAESVGRLTTQSVVESIFLVIVFDALFSIMFSYLGI